jgi:hypothetical protein
LSIIPFRRPEKPAQPENHQLADKLVEETGQPHGAGDAFCMGCSHTWAAVAPCGETTFECPACHAKKGHWVFEFTPPEDKIWTCNCGNQLFNITPRGTFCPNCGDYMRF